MKARFQAHTLATAFMADNALLLTSLESSRVDKISSERTSI